MFFISISAALGLSCSMWGLRRDAQALEPRHEGFRAVGFSGCGMASVALRHVGSSRTRDRTCVPYTARQVLNHWTIREVPKKCILSVELDEF